MARLLKKISAASLLLLGSQLLLFLTMRLNSDRMGPDDYGRFGLAMSVAICVAQFIQWGMDSYLTVRFVRGSASDSRRLLGLLLRQKQIAGILILLAAALAAFLWNPQSERELIFLGALDGVILGFTMPAAFDARGQTLTWQLFAFLRHCSYVAAVLVIASFFKFIYSPLTVLALHALAIFFEVALEQFWILKRYGAPDWPVPIRETLPLWRDTASMALAMLAQQMLYFLGPPALQFFSSTKEMGALYLSNQFTIGAAGFAVAPAAIIHARLAAHLDSDPNGRAAFSRKVWLATLAFTIAGIVYALAFDIVSGRIATVFFSKYPEAPGIISVDALRIIPIFASGPLASALICRGRLSAFAIAHVVGLLTGVAVAALFVPNHGAKAAAAAVAAGRLAFLVLCAVCFILDADPRKSPA